MDPIMGPKFLVRIGQNLWVLEYTVRDWDAAMYWQSNSVNYWRPIGLSDEQGLGSRDGLVLDNGPMCPIFLVRIGQAL